MPTEIRILRQGDEAILNSVAEGVFDDPVLLHAAQEFLSDPRHHLAVALEDDRVVGFASGVHYVHPDKPHPELWINEVGVAESHQGRGIGKALMHALLEAGRELGCIEAWVLTERDNGPAMRLYQSLGGEAGPDQTVMFTFHLKDDRDSLSPGAS